MRKSKLFCINDGEAAVIIAKSLKQAINITSKVFDIPKIQVKREMEKSEADKSYYSDWDLREVRTLRKLEKSEFKGWYE